MTRDEEIAALRQQVDWLSAQVANLYARLQLPYVQRTNNPGDGRTDVGMGPIISPDKTSFL